MGPVTCLRFGGSGEMITPFVAQLPPSAPTMHCCSYVRFSSSPTESSRLDPLSTFNHIVVVSTARDPPK